MTGKLRIGIEFVGVVNGVPVAIAGKAHVGQGRLDAELHAAVVPYGFDPALLVLGGLDAVLLLTARDDALAVPDHRVHVHLDWTLLDENHRDLGGLTMASVVELVPGGLELRGQFRGAQTRMEPVERVVAVAEVGFGAVVPFGVDGLVLTTTSGFETDFGNGYQGVAVSRIVGLEGWEPASGLDVRRVTVERAGGRERDCRVLVGVEYGELGSKAGRADGD